MTNADLNAAGQALLAALMQFGQTALMIGLPILTAYGVRWLRVQGKLAWAKLQASDNKALIDMAQALASLAVRAAEQSWNGVDGQQGDAKRDYAVKLVSNWLESRGVQLDEGAIVAAVEAAVWSELNAPMPTLSVAAPEA